MLRWLNHLLAFVFGRATPVRKPVVEEIEPRILYSADVNPLLWGGVDPNATAIVGAVDSGSSAASVQSVGVQQQQRREIIFIDAAVVDAQTLIDGLIAARPPGTAIEVVQLQAGSDGLHQIGEVLANEHDLNTIHIVSHGDDALLQLGSTRLDADTLAQRGDEIAAWRSALDADADLMLYGCDVGRGDSGAAFIERLAQLSGADVAASTDATGASALGGNWVLEAQSGQIESQLLLANHLEQSWNSLLALTVQGSETRVNTTATSTQTTSSDGGTVAMDSAGNYVVVWNDANTNSGDVYFQRYNASGVAQGGNVLVNSTTANLQSASKVAMDASGNFVVVWASASQDGSGDGVYAQRYNASGVAQGGEFRVNTTTANSQNSPTVAMSSSGAFVVAWSDSAADGAGTGVYAQRYNAAGAAQGAQFRVNTTTAGDQGFASAAMDGLGNFVIAWDSDQSGDFNVYRQRYNASGVAQGGEVLVNTTTTGTQWNAAAAMDYSGNFVIVWESATQDSGGNAGIYGQRFNASGVAQGSEFHVNTTTANDQVLPAVAMNAGGGFIVAWNSNSQDGSGYGIYTQQYDVSGSALGGEVRAATTTANDQIYPAVAYKGSQAAIIWSGNGTGDTSGVFMQRYSVSTPPAITVTPTAGLATTEAGGTAQFNVVLNSAPTATVTIAVSSSDTTEGTVSTSLLTFTTANWATPQTVTVTGVDDALADGFQAYSIVLAAATSSDGSYNALNPSDVQVGNADNDITYGLITVDSTSDTSDGDTSSLSALAANRGADGFISLREAIIAANNTANGAGGADRIVFNIAGTGVHTITLSSLLPTISDSVTIDASTDDSFAANGNRPAIVLNGNNAIQDGLRLYSGSDGSTVRGLVIQRFTEDGIDIASSSGNTIAGNWVGLTSAGTAAAGNFNGVNIFGGNNNVIGGLTAADRNVISGNAGPGVWVGGGGTGNQIRGNYIGTNAAGTAAVANAASGIDVYSGGNVIGGTAAGAGNVISGNSVYGVSFSGAAASGNTVAGNFIGLTAAGTVMLGNGNDGVFIIDGASNNTIGGTTVAARNVIAGNSDGVQIGGAAGGSNNNVVQGNYIGTDVTGTLDFGNNDDGVDIDNAALNNRVIGNLISGNTSDGIDLGDAGASTGTVIQGNLIGTAANGSSALGNAGRGIFIGNGGTANNTLIGGAVAGQGNTVAFNALAGIYVPASTAVAMLGNMVFSNGGLGIDLGTSGITANDAGDADSGANGLQNFPLLSSANSNAAGTTIAGSLNSNANTTYRIEFFANRPTVADATNGEGERYLGFITVTTDGAGNATISTTLASVWVNSGDRISATATVDLGGGTYGSTSEFAANVIASSTGIIVVDTTSDANDGTTTSITNLGNARGADGRISLREAIIAANNTANGGTPDKIVFAIPVTDANHVYYRDNAVAGTFSAAVSTTLADPAIVDFDADYVAGTARSWYRIALSGSNLDVTQAVIIDGSTQAGYSAATGPIIELNAAGITAPAGDLNALALTTGASTVRGLVINRASDNAIEIDVGATSSVIVGNYIGTDVSGTQALGNSTVGTWGAIAVKTNNVVIGGTTVADRNLISGNNGYGIEFYSSASGTVVQGNYIGTNVTGSAALGNISAGIYVRNSANGNTIGGTGANQGNLIAYNGGDGIWVDATAAGGNALLGNTLVGNTGLAIDLGANDVTANDAGDADSGANSLQNFPVLTTARTDGAGQLILTGTLNSSASTQYRIEFFANTAQDGTGYGEGQRYLGFANVTTDGSGNATISTTLTATVAVGEFISATATKSNAGFTAFTDTSEMARNVAAVSSTQATIAVTTTSDVSDGDTTSLSTLLANKGADGFISLREAIIAANNTANGSSADLIAFNIAGTGVKTINVSSVLPTITGAVVIDGTTQRTFSGDVGSNPLIELNGGNLGTLVKGLTLGAGSSGSTVSGLIINRFTGSGVEISGANNQTIQGNWIGLDATGTAAAANGVNGIYALNSTGNLIGGTTAAARNVISGNAQQGIYFDNADSSTISGNYIGTNAAGTGDVTGTVSNTLQSGVYLGNGSSGNVIGGTTASARNVISGNNHYGFEVLGATSLNNLLEGNYIGTTASGLAALGNTNGGASFWGAGTGNVFGGTAAGAGNVIAGNLGNGVLVGSAVTGATIQGNYIGVGADGTTALGNSADGINVQGSSTNTAIGGATVGAGNVIANSGLAGVAIVSGTGHLVLGNTIYGNAALGIDLGTAGVTANDVGDGDSGANNLQNFPLLASAASSGGSTTISGSFNSNASTTYRIEFFSSPTADASGYGEGRAYLGFATVTTDGSGNVPINAVLAGVSVTAGHGVSATATVDLGGGNYGNSSEFAASVVCQVPPVNTVPGAKSVNEDSALVINGVSVADPDGNLSSVRLTVANGTLNVSLAGGTTISVGANASASLTLSGTQVQINAALAAITYQGTSNFNGSDTLTVLSTDTLGATDSDTVAITVTAVNDVPVITSDGGGATAALNVAENTSAVTTVTSTDIDGGAAVYSIAGGADAARFTINAGTGVLTFVAAPNYEAPSDTGANNVYDVTVQVSDGAGGTDTQAIAVTVTPTNDNAPVITSNGGGATATANVAENQTTVTTVVATDADLPAQTITYSIVGGADAARFTINASSGALAFVAAPNYEAPTDAGANNVYDVIVQASDGALTDTQAIAVSVTPVNEAAPVITSNGGGTNAAISVAENSSAVTTVTATDSDLPAPTLTYSISGGVDAALFSINASTGVLTFATAPDYEAPVDNGANNVYDVIVQASDGTLTDTQAIAVTVTPVNDNAPVITSNGGGASASISVAENATAVTTVIATDADLPAPTITYSITGGADAARFTINASTGALAFVAAPDYEAPADAGANNVYDLIVQASDGTLTDTQAIAVTVTAVNDNAPVITSNGGGATASVSIAENSSAVTTVAASDADLPAPTMTYSIVGGADAARFTINASTGALSFVAALDYEAPADAGANNVYDVTVMASDGSFNDTQAIAVTVTAVNDNAPVITSNGGGATAAVSIAENTSAVTTVVATDADLPAQTITYSIVGGADAALFSINASTGALFLSAPNYEAPADAGANNVYDVIVQASDGAGLTDTQAIAVTVTPANDNAPVITSNGGGAAAAVSVAENTTAVTTVTATDADLPAQTLTYSISGGADALRFTINAGSGVLSFATAPNYELPADAGANNVYDVVVMVSDGGGFADTQAIAVTVTPINDNAPVIGSNGGGATASVFVAENSTAVTTVTANDADLPAQTLVYSISGGADAALFSIDSATGVLSFNSAPNFEAPADAGANNVYDVTVQVSDGAGGTDTQAIAVSVTNANEAPVITSDGGGATASVNAAEYQSAVTTVTSTDVDGGTAVYSIAGGADAALFAINASTGVLTFVAAPNFEAPADAGGNNIYDVTVQVSDGSLTDTQAIAVSVTNVNEAPVISSNGGASTAGVNVAENQTAVTTVTSTDVDGGVPTYSINGGADAALFTINATNGVLTFNTAPNFETPADAGADNVYDVTVQVADGSGGVDTQAIAITVTNVNEAPVITSHGGGASAAINVAENQSAVGTVTSTDVDGGALAYTIVGGADAALFSIDSVTGILTFNSAPNFEAPADAGGDDIYDVTVQVADGNGGFDTQTIAVSVTDVNEAPVISSNGGGNSAAINAAENQSAVTTVTSTDVDGGTPGYSIAGGADAALFSIDSVTGVLTFNTAPNFEAPADAGADNVYDVTVQVADGSGGVDTQTIAVAVSNVNEAPVITSGAAVNAAENQTAVTTVSSTDVDGGAPSYSIVGGADQGLFTIDAATGVLSFLTAPNFEAPADAGGNNVYDVTVQVSDGALTDTQAIAVTVTNINEAPVITSNGAGAAAAISSAENQAAVTTVTSTDVDGAAPTYSISGGADAALFTINASTGVLAFATAPDFEAPADAGSNNVYDVAVQVSDGSLTDTQAIAVTVTNVNEAPVITSNGAGATAAVNVAENQTAVTTVTSTDVDGGTPSYSIVGGADAALFTINATTGVLTFNTAPNFETPADAGADNIYDVTVQVADGNAGVDTQAIAITVTNVNEAPVITSGATVSAAENQTAVTTVASTDVDGTVPSYSIVGGADAALFTINASTGALTFVTAPNFESPADAGSNNVYDVTVQVSDGALTDTQAIAVTVINVNEAPVITSSAAVSAAENQTAVTTVTSTDVDGPAPTYSIVGGADAALFTINAATGVLTFNTAPNFEVPADAGGNNVYDVTVQVSDGSLTDTQAIAVTVANVNEAPVITSSASVSAAENQAAVTTVTSTDVDGPAPAYSISGGADAALFSIDGVTGVLTFNSAPNFEAPADAGADNVYDVAVQVADGNGGTDTQALSITVTNVNEAPVITSSGAGATAAVSVGENQTVVTAVTSTDVDGAAPVYSIVGGADAALFTINASTGALTFVTAPDFEAPADAGGNNVYDVTIQVSDGSLTDTQAMAVTVTNVNEAPVITSSASVSTTENQTAVTTVTSTDVDGAAPTYSISGGADAALFTINASTGALTFVTAPNFEAPADAGGNNVYDVTIQVSDGSLTDTLAIAVTVTNVNEAPVITSNGAGATAAVNAAENQTAVTTVTSTDVDGGTPSYSIVGGADAALFTINATTGVLTFNTAPNFETPADAGADNIYDLTVQVADGNGGTATQALAVTVINVNEAPVITSGATVSAAENQTAVTTVASTDVDGAVPSYSIVGGADAALFTINAATGVLTFNTAPNFEAPTDAGADNVYDVTVQVSDGALTDTQAIAVTVTNVNEAPVITSSGGGSSAAINAAENQSAVTTVASTDVDGGTPGYSIAGGADAALFSIDSVTGVLTFNTAPDFELPTDAGANGVYNVTVQVADGNGGVDTQTIAITVTNVNESPLITSSAAVSVAENQTAATTVASTDVDGGAPAYTIVGGADAALFSIDSATGVLSFNSAPNFEAPADAGGNNVYDVTVQVADGNGGFDTQAIAVMVTNVNEAPLITSNGGGASANLTAAEIQTAVTTVASTDVDGATPSYSIAGGADAALFSIDSVTGVLTFNTAPDFELPTDAGANGIYNVTVQVADGNGGVDTQAIAITVTNVNEAPVISSNGGGVSASLSVAENQTAVTAVTSADVDGGTAQYSIVGGADAARFAINANSGALRFAAAPNFEAPTDADANNVYELTVQAADGNGGTDTQTIAVAVTGVNEAPGNIAPAAASVNEQARAGTVVAIVTASDPDAGDLFTFTLVNDGNGRFVVDPSSGRLTVAPGAVLDFETEPSLTLLLRVTDAQGLRTEQQIVVTLRDVVEALPAVVPSGLPPPAPAPVPAPELVPAPSPVPATPSINPTPAIERETSDGRGASVAAASRGLVGAALHGLESHDEADSSSRRAHGRPLRDDAPLLVASVSFTADGAALGGWSDPVLDGLLMQQTSDSMAPRFAGSALRGSSFDTDRDDDASAARHRSLDEALVAALQDPVRVASATLTAGFVWWLTRSGGLLTSILMGIPAWRHVDLLPVLAPARDDEDDADDIDDETKVDERDSIVDEMFSNTSRQFGESRFLS